MMHDNYLNSIKKASRDGIKIDEKKQIVITVMGMPLLNGYTNLYMNDFWKQKNRCTSM